jgi:hypothetical protein
VSIKDDRRVVIVGYQDGALDVIYAPQDTLVITLNWDDLEYPAEDEEALVDKRSLLGLVRAYQHVDPVVQQVASDIERICRRVDEEF